MPIIEGIHATFIVPVIVSRIPVGAHLLLLS